MADLTFSRCVLAPQERVLRCDGVIVPLPPKAVAILEVLARTPGVVVAKDELIERVWGAEPVEEGNLTHAIFKLRRAFEAHDPCVVIQTIPRRGYRLSVSQAPSEYIAERLLSRYMRLVVMPLVLLLASPMQPEHADVSVAVQRGFTIWEQARSTADVQQSLAWFRIALHADANSAAAHAGMAYALISMALRENDPVENAANARLAIKNARAAIALNPSLVAGHAALGQAESEFDDAKIAERELRQATLLDPTSVESQTWLGELLFAKGNVPEATAHFRSAQYQQSTWTEAGDDLALIAYLDRNFDRAHAYADQSLARDPADRFAMFVRALSDAPNDPRRAANDLREMTRKMKGAVGAHALLAYEYARLGDRRESETELVAARRLVSGTGTGGPLIALSFAAVFAKEGRLEDAYAWLSHMNLDERKTYAKDARLDALRNEPRFGRWLRGA